MRDVKRIVGEKIRALRESQGLLQRELAHKAGVPVRTIGRIERGEVDVRLSTLDKIAKALGVSIKEFF
jgi:transcriptional regulator with XRE-family HTH domain